MSSQHSADLCVPHQVSFPYSGITHCPPSSPTRPGSSISTDYHPESSLTAENYACHGEKLTNPCQLSIDSLPDEALLEIFYFCVDEDASTKKDIEAWPLLVHVCRRWRSVVFGSQRRLNLRLVCRPEIPVTPDKLDVWPPLPIVIRGGICGMGSTDPDGDHLVAILERRDRVCQIDLWDDELSDFWDYELSLENLMVAMQEPFPELTDLVLRSYWIMATDLPDSFLGGSAPRLRKLQLYCVPFPDLPKLLLSATHLVEIRLYQIPYSGYFSLEALVTALSTLTSLRLLILKFQSSPSLESRCLPQTRFLLPDLNTLKFQGCGEYLDDLVAHINTPRLNNLEITFFDEDELDVPRFTQFIHRTPMLEALERAYVNFDLYSAAVKLSSQTSGCGELKVNIPCRWSNQQVLTLKQFCISYLHFSILEDVYIHRDIYSRPDLEDDIENIVWLELLHLFTGVKNLYLSKDIAPHIGPALQELVGGSTTEVLPVVRNISLEGIQQGPVLDGIETFIAARQLSGQPITVSTIPRWERDLMRWASELHNIE